MSGGSFDYNSLKISQFAEDLREKIDHNDKYSSSDYGAGFEKGTLAALEECHSLIQLAGKIAHHVEWLYSGEHSEEDFLRLVEKDLELAEDEQKRRQEDKHIHESLL